MTANLLTSRVALIRSIGAPFESAVVELDAPRDEEVLVRVEAAGLCHSDLGSSRDDWGDPLPWIGGHEVAGTVIATGPHARLSEGDFVVAVLTSYCGRCARCRAGRSWLCCDGDATARGSDAPPRVSEQGRSVGQFAGIGGFGSYVLAHQNLFVAIERGLPAEQACLLGCGVLTGAGAVLRSARVPAGSSVAVFGAGGVGLSAVQAARIAGAERVIAVDLAVDKLDLARALGASDTVDASQLDAAEAVRELTGGVGVDFAFDFVGTAAVSVAAIHSTTVGGQTHLIGVHRLGAELGLRATEDLIMARRSLHGVYMGNADPRSFVPELARLAQRAQLDLASMVTSTIDIDQVAWGYERMLAGVPGRAVITDFKETR